MATLPPEEFTIEHINDELGRKKANAIEVLIDEKEGSDKIFVEGYETRLVGTATFYEPAEYDSQTCQDFMTYDPSKTVTEQIDMLIPEEEDDETGYTYDEFSVYLPPAVADALTAEMKECGYEF